METRTFKLSSYDINPSNNLADYYNQTVTTQYGTVADNRMSLTWNNVNLQQIVGNDFYNAYNRFSIKLVTQAWYGAPTSDSGSIYSQQQYQDTFVNVYLKGLPFYPPVYNSQNGALVNTLNYGLVSTTTGGTPGLINYNNSINWTFLKTSSINLGVNIRSAATEQPYSPGDISTYLWGHSVYYFEIKGITDVSNVSYIDLSNNSILHNGVHTIYTDLTPSDPINYTTSSRANDITITSQASSISFSSSIPSSIVYETNLTSVLVTTIVGQLNGETLSGTVQYYLDSNFTNEVLASSVLNYGSYTIYALFTPTSADYSVSFTSIGLIVTQKSTILTYPSLPSIVYGTQVASSLTASCTVAGTIQYYYDISHTLIVDTLDLVAFGTHSIYAVFTPTADNYLSSTASSSLTVTKAPTTLTYNALSAITYETTIAESLNATVLPSIAGTTNYYLDNAHTQLISSTDVFNVATYTIYALFTPSSSNYSSSTASSGITVNKHTTSLTFPVITTFAYGTTLNKFISETTNVGGIAGTYSFHIDNESGITLSNSTQLTVGTYSIYCKFTPTNATNYLSSTNTTSLKVTNFTTTIAFSPSIASSIVYNTTLTNILSTSVTENIAGTVSYYYINSSNVNIAVTAATVLNVGIYTIYATFTPTVSDYAASETTTSLTVTQATPVITYSGLSSINYETTLSSSLNATVAPSMAGSFKYYLNSNKTSEVLSSTVLNVGSYTIYVFFTPTSGNYTSASQYTSLVVNKFVSELDYLITSSSIFYGTAIDQCLTASLTTTIPGTITYYLNSAHTELISSTDIFIVGTYTIYALFEPTVGSNYTTATNSNTVTVYKRATVLTFSNISSIVYETTLANFITGTRESSGVAGIYQFYINDSNGLALSSASVLYVNSYTIYCLFTPSNTINYKSIDDTTTLSVTTHSTSISYSPSIPTSLVYGTTLSQVLSTVVTPNVAGTLKYYTDIDYTTEVISSTVLNVATYTIYAVFTPTSSDYTSSMVSTILSVTQATTSVTYATLSNIVYGTTLSSSFTAYVTPSIQGAFNYYYMNGATKISLNAADVLNVGSYTIYSDFTPNSSNYIASTNYQSLSITTAPTTVIYNTLSNIVYTTSLASSLNATVYPNISGLTKYYINSVEVISTTVLDASAYLISATFTPTSSNYAPSTTIKSLTINKKSTSLTFPSISTIVYETTLASLISGTSTGIAGLYSFHLNNLTGYSLSSATVLNIGNYTIFCKFVPSDATNYLSSESTTNLSVSVHSTSVSYSPSIASTIIYETTLANILSASVTPSVAGSIAYSIDISGVDTTTVLNIGTYIITATFTPSSVDYAQSSVTTTLTVTPKTTTLSYTIPSSIVYGTTLNSSLTATCTTAGTITYYYDISHTIATSSSDILDVGTYAIYALFTPSTANYLLSTASVNFTITAAETTLSYGLSTPTTITYETALTSVLSATVSPIINGTTAYYYINSSSTRVDVSVNDILNVGNYTIRADFTPINANYKTPSTAITNLYVSQKPIEVSYSGLSAITYGQTLSSSLTATIAHIVNGNLKYYLESAQTTLVTDATVLPASTYTVYAVFTPDNSLNYVSYPVNTALVVNKATPTLTYGTLPSIIYGTSLLTSLTASISPSVNGTIAYYLINDLISSSQILTVGTYTLRAEFTSNDSNYNSTSTTSSLQVLQQSTSITFSSITSLTYNTTLASFISQTTASVAGSFRFYLGNDTTLTSSTVLSASATPYTIYCRFDPSDTTNYTIKVSSTSLTVQKQTTSVTMASISTLVYGDTLSSFIGGTTATVPGTFNFYINNTSGQLLTTATILSGASYTIYCAFVPTDTTNYLSSYNTKTLAILPHATAITLSSINGLTYGNTLSTFISGTAAFINGTSTSVAGTFKFYINDASGQLLTSSTILSASATPYTIFCVFSPTVTANFSQSTNSKTLSVQQQTTTITLSTISSLVYGDTLSSFIGGTTATVPGTFNFYLNDAFGQSLNTATVLSPSSTPYTIYCAFVPSDTINYLPSTNSKSLTIQKHTTAITLSSTNSLVYGTQFSSFMSGTTSSLPDGGIMVAVGVGKGNSNLKFIATSIDGITWTPNNQTLLDKEIRCVGYGNGLWVAAGIGYVSQFQNNYTWVYKIITSPDGITWTERVTPSNFSGKQVVYANGIWVMVGWKGAYNTTCIITSPDGIIWTERSYIFSGGAKGVAYANGIWVAVGSGTATIVTSVNGITWTERATSTQIDIQNFGSIAYGNGLFVVTGDNGILFTSTDGINWIQRLQYQSLLKHIVSSAYGNGKWIALGLNSSGYGTIAISTNGITWTNPSINIIPDTQAIPITFANNLWFLVSTSALYSSPDGIVWTLRDSSIFNSCRGIASSISPVITPVDGSLNFYINNASGQQLTETTVLTVNTYTIYAAFVPSNTTNYLSSTATKSLEITKQDTTINLSSINSLVYGDTFSSFISGTTASVDGSFNFYVTNVLGQKLTSSTILSANTYTIYCTFVPSDTTNFATSSASKSLVIQKQATSITLSGLSGFTYGDTFNSFISGTTAIITGTSVSVAGTFNFYVTNASGQQLTSSTVLTTASYTIFCTFTPNTSNYLSSTATKTAFVVSKRSTTISLYASASIVYSTTFASFITGTTANVAGTFNFYINDASGQQLTSSTVLTVATYTIFCAFVPSDTTNNLPSTNSKTFAITKKTPSLTMSIINSLSYSTSLASFINGTTASVDGSFNFYVNNASGQHLATTTILDAATYTIYCAFVPTDTINYLPTSNTKQLTILQQTPTIVYGALSAITYGTSLNSRLNATYTPIIDGTLKYYINSIEVLLETILNASSSPYTITATFTPVSPNYTTASTTSTLVVNKASTSVTYPSLQSLLYSEPLGNTRLNATVSPVIAGTMNYFTDSAFTNQIFSTTTLSQGSYTLYARFTPASSNYSGSSGSSALIVFQLIPTTITFPNLTTIPVYTTLESFINMTTTGIPGTYVFRKNNSTGAILTATSIFDTLGNFLVYCSFTPTSILYSNSFSSYNVKVKFTPTILFTQRPSSTITYGTNLTGSTLSTNVSQFNNTNIAGTITYSNSITTNTILLPGLYTVTATFTPTNLSLFNVATTSTYIFVNKQQFAINITSPSVKSAFIKSTPIDCSYQVWGILSALGDTFENSVVGTIVNRYTNMDETTLLTSDYVYNTTFSGSSQTYKIAADISGFSSTKYEFVHQSYTFTVNKYTPTINYTVQTANKTLTYGTKLSTSQLNAIVLYGGNTTTSGSVVYTRSAINMALTVDTQTVLDVGQHYLYAYFSDLSGNLYNSVDTSIVTTNRITIDKATPTFSFLNISSILSGSTMADMLNFVVAVSNGSDVAGTFAFTYVNGSGATVYLTSTTVLTSPPSTITITATFTPSDTTRYNVSTATKSVQISDQLSSISTTALLSSPIVYGKTFNEIYSINVSPSGLAGTFAYYDDVYTFDPTQVIDAGSYTYTVIFNPSSSAYASSLVDVVFTVTNATLTITYASPPSYQYQTANQLSLLQPAKSVAIDGVMQICLDSAFTTPLTPMAVGTHTIYARFTPVKNYNVATTTTTLTVTKIPTSLLYVTQTSSITFGETNASFLNNSAVNSIQGTIQYYYDISFTQIANSTDVLEYGTQTIYYRFVPTDSNYAMSYATHTVNVNKNVLTISYSALNPIQYGTTLASSLSASSTFDGSINYFINGTQVYESTQLNGGSYTITAIFTSSNPNNFTTSTVSITRTLIVTKQATVITYANPSNIVSGATFAASMTATVSPNIAGTMRYFTNSEEILSSTVLSIGNYTIIATFTPTILTNYTSSLITVAIAVITGAQRVTFNENVQRINNASNNQVVSIVSQNQLLPSTLSVKVNQLTANQTTFTAAITATTSVTSVKFNFLDGSVGSNVKVAVTTLTVNLPGAANSPAIYFKFYDETGNSVINGNNRVSMVLNLPVYKGLIRDLYLLRMQDIGTDFDGTRIPLTSVNPSDSQNSEFTAIFTSNSVYVASIIPSATNELTDGPLLSNVYTFQASGGFSMQRGFNDLKLRDYTVVETYDVTDSVQVLFDVALFNAKLGIIKNATNTQIISSIFNPVTDQFENNGESVNTVSFTASEFVNGVIKSQQIISVGKYSNAYTDFKNYVSTYFGYDGGFSSLFTAASEFTIDDNNTFNSSSMLQLFIGATSTSSAYINEMTGSFSVADIVKSLRYSVNTNCFGNRNPTISGVAVDPSNSSNYGVGDGFVAGDLIWINSGTTFNINLNIDMESFAPLNNSGSENVLGSQNTNYNSLNFSQNTTATTTNINRTIKAPLLIKLVNASTISAL